jgi:hypothetical protein
MKSAGRRHPTERSAKTDQHMLGAQNGRQLRRRLNSILQWDNECFGSDYGSQLLSSLFHLPCFYADQNDIDVGNLRCVISNSVTCAGRITISPTGVSMLKPCIRIAFRCSPRAMKMTSSPARANCAPKYPPAPPVPKITTRIAAGPRTTRSNPTGRECGSVLWAACQIKVVPGAVCSCPTATVCIAWALEPSNTRQLTPRTAAKTRCYGGFIMRSV